MNLQLPGITPTHIQRSRMSSTGECEHCVKYPKTYYKTLLKVDVRNSFEKKILNVYVHIQKDHKGYIRKK